MQFYVLSIIFIVYCMQLLVQHVCHIQHSVLEYQIPSPNLLSPCSPHLHGPLESYRGLSPRRPPPTCCVHGLCCRTGVHTIYSCGFCNNQFRPVSHAAHSRVVRQAEQWLQVNGGQQSDPSASARQSAVVTLRRRTVRRLLLCQYRRDVLYVGVT